MTEPARFESPLVELGWPAGGIGDPSRLHVRERAGLGHLNLRGDAADARFHQAVLACVGIALPDEPNRWIAGVGGVLLWLGPDEWLLITAGGKETAMTRRLEAALDGLHAGVTDVSGGQTVIVLRGAHARDLLAKGCGLDLHPRRFGPGDCAQSLLERVGVCIRQVDDAPTYELVVRRSFADYLGRWIVDAGAEFGLGAAATD